jgi:hypothetical protein
VGAFFCYGGDRPNVVAMCRARDCLLSPWILTKWGVSSAVERLIPVDVRYSVLPECQRFKSVTPQELFLHALLLRNCCAAAQRTHHVKKSCTMAGNAFTPPVLAVCMHVPINRFPRSARAPLRKRVRSLKRKNLRDPGSMTTHQNHLT